MKNVLTIYAVGSLFLILLAFIENRVAQMRANDAIRLLHRAYPQDAGNPNVALSESATVERGLRHSADDMRDFAWFGGAGFILSMVARLYVRPDGKRTECEDKREKEPSPTQAGTN